MAEDRKPWKIIVPLQKSPDGATRIDKVHTTAGMLERALGIIDDQLIKISLKSKAAILDDKESRVLTGYVDALVKLSKEEREREKDDKTAETLKSMSNEELLQLAEQSLKTLSNPAADKSK